MSDVVEQFKSSDQPISLEPQAAQTKTSGIVGVFLGGREYYTLRQLAEAFGVPEHHFKRRVRNQEFGGRKIGTAYVVDAEEFNNWVKSGRFEFKPRRKRRIGK